MKKKIYQIIIHAVVAITAVSCTKYLDVEPKSSLSENEMFASELGFDQALSGVYATLAARSLYGDNMTMGFTAALAQNYATSGLGSLFVDTRAYNYSSTEFTRYASSIWTSAYNTIASVNNILKFAESNRNVLSTSAYQQITGEAYAIRALLHFDLLRLFAPSFASNTNGIGIPYRKTIDQNPTAALSITEIIDNVLEDLDIAETLLKELDPIFDNTMQRRFKMNYYAIKGLQARVYHYKGEEKQAYDAAKVIVDSQQFPFVATSSVNTTIAGTKDRLFMSELVFALRNRNIGAWAVNSYFTILINSRFSLTRPLADLSAIYEGNTNDLRYANLFENSSNVLISSKFWQTSTSEIDSLRLDRMVPVIRMSEMCYILAETAPTEDEALDHLNRIRNARHLVDLPKNSNTLNRIFIQDEITKEYQKEFYAEGQLFLYYKRKDMNQFQFSPANFSKSAYVLPTPELEKEFNLNYQSP
ncbi:RagB/SusD family nutrient uptake outer membrane protein [Sphingobacterium rhinopitheci]|uniref:RagB/SusD family nutrient uptake outer membrane protein n=1 Tax=Sphingobacterium rhinopitheci TaxID=2781960 RepID=UPI001F5286AD|nr:RagB/SusD family nutrient uptake outer membrane protein [Sphingobacterium rhinopitheci]MCI0920574.1 RagB/SusD family nutrient uptake outer membrane protein [Sphingobacterium rhinopitheci]